MSRHNKRTTLIRDSADGLAALQDAANRIDGSGEIFSREDQPSERPNTYFDVVSGIDDGHVYYNEKWVAQRLGLSVKTIQSWRDKGDGPPYRKFNSAVRYSLDDLEAYERAALRTSTSDNGPGGRNA